MDNIDKAPLHPQNNHQYYEVLPFAEYVERLKKLTQEEHLIYDDYEDLEDDDFDDI